jgi:hypothetical protein
MNTTTTVYPRRAGFAKREAVGAYACGHLAAHRSVTHPQHWTVTHPESGMAVTDGRVFDSKAQAMRYAEEIQRHLDFGLLEQGADMAWDVQKAFGSENIRRAMSAAFQEAFGS